MVEYILAIENHVIPPHRTDVFDERDINASYIGIAFVEDAIDLLGLPVDDAGHQQRQTTGRVLLPLPILGGHPSLFAISYIPGQGMNLFTFEETAARALSEGWIRHIVQDVFGLEDAPQFPVRPVEMISPTVRDESYQCS